MPRIVFKKNEHPPVDLAEAVTVGRSANHANVVVQDNRLSRAHCRFEPRDDGWSVVDLESQNGTFLNGRRVREALVKPGDVVTIGTCDMVFEEVGGPGGKTVMAGVHSTKSAPPDFSDESLAVPTAEKSDSTRTVVAPAALVLVKGTLLDKIHPITVDPFVIGRKHDTQLCLENDGKASGHHAHIRRDGMDYVLEDLGSTNGVVVNGEKITGPVVLKPGMKVLLGQQLFKFQLQGRDDVSSGRTAPAIAAADIQARLKPPGQAGESADLDEPDQPATIMATPAEQAALNEDDDKAALSQEIKFKSGGGGVFAVVEIIVVVAVAGAILFSAWTMLKDDGTAGGGGEGGYPPSRDGGLLATNPSFDDVDEGGYATGWNYVVSGTDSFNLVEGARGGRYAMQISRFGPANEASFVVSERMEAPAGGVKVSVFALNGEASAERFGSALVSVFWYASKRDSAPMLVTPLTARTRMPEWVELAGSASAPAGAKLFAVALGMCGAQGSVAFDEVTVSAEAAAENWFAPQSIGAGGGMNWQIDDRGDISLNGPDGVYLRGGRIVLFQAQQRRDPLQVLEMLVAKPEVQRTDNMLNVKYRYFDPLAAQPVQLTLQLGSRGGVPVLEASVQAVEGTLDRAARYVSLHVLATPAWAPAELVRFEKPDAQPAAYTMEIGTGRDTRGEFAILLSADTGTGNRIIAGEGGLPGASAFQHPAGRELMITQQGALSLGFKRGGGLDELQEQASLVAAVQPGEDQMDRVDRALGIFRDYLYNQQEVASAALAIDAASKHYSLRLIELRDGINVPQLTRNEQLYRAAMEEAIASADKLRAASDRWNRDAMPMLRLAIGDNMLPRTKDSAAQARDALRELIDLADSFEALAKVARKSLFALEVEIEQRESESYMVSARDFLDSGQYVQGMVKLRAVVANYPRCLRGIEAKERMLDVAAILLNEMDDLNKQNLRNIAGDRARQVRELLDLVEGKLLTRILSPDEKNWLRGPDLPAELRSGEWISRENDLAKRIADMRRRLPGEGE
ncbi:MAG: FHA domain-containing protein [Planctomycetes bacterium]|nr:FHA domain-containing protein [Planctomycetota bacterium]MCB9935996.1 FHA domain-containing protein [Planctomycetota bacterium]